MKKLYLVKIGYQGFVVSDPEVVVKILGEAIAVGEEYIDHEKVYTPEKGQEISCVSIKESQLRVLTVEEKENKELASAKSNAEWSNKEAERLRKEVEELKCQLKVALKKEE